MALFVGRIPREMNNRDLEDAFSKYGKITRLDVKKGFGFVEYDDKRDAEDAIKGINERGDLVVEWAKNGGKRPGENECFHCGKEGHWARDCLEAGREGGRDGGRDGGRGGGRGGMGGGRGGGFGRDRSPRRDGGRGNDRDRRDNRGYERRRDDRDDRGGRDERDDRGGRDRSPHRNDYRERNDRGDRGFDRRGGGDRRDDRREYVPRDDRRREDDRMAPERNQLE